MALTEQEAEWTVRFSAGAVQARAIGASPKKSKAEDLEEKLRRARDKEEVKEQALKDMLLEKTLAADRQAPGGIARDDPGDGGA